MTMTMMRTTSTRMRLIGEISFLVFFHTFDSCIVPELSA